MKLKTFKQLNESSESDFLLHYDEEIRNAIKLLTKLHSFSLGTDDTDDAIIDNEKLEKLEKRLSVYDTNVQSKIEDWTYDIPTRREIAEFALRNQDRWGTEPQMVLFAIEDYAQACNIYIDHEDDEDDE